MQDFKEWSKPNVDEFVKISKWPEDGKRCRVVWWLMKSFVFRVYTVAYDKRIFLRFSPLRPPLFPKWYLRARVCVCFFVLLKVAKSAFICQISHRHWHSSFLWCYISSVPARCTQWRTQRTCKSAVLYFHLRCTNCAVRMWRVAFSANLLTERNLL